MLVSILSQKGGLHFDDQIRRGTTPTYSWKKMDNFPVPPHFFNLEAPRQPVDGQGIVVANGNLYVAGLPEKNDYGSFKAFARFSIDSQEWTVLAHMSNRYPSIRNFAIVALDGFIYTIGSYPYNTNPYFSDTSEQLSTFIGKYDMILRGDNCMLLAHRP